MKKHTVRRAGPEAERDFARGVVRVLLLICSLGIPAGGQSAEAKDLAKGKVGKAIAAWVEDAEAKGFRGAILAARQGRVVAAVGAGFADVEDKVRNTPATLFEIASFSKQITAAAAVRLAQISDLSIDDPIAKHLTGIPDDCSGITLRHLLQHTSGIPGSNTQGSGDDLSRVLPGFLQGGPQHEPGTHWEYWNQGYALATEVIARAAGMPFTAFCEKELFRPAKMKSTGFNGDEAPPRAIVAVGRSKHGAPRSALEHPYGNSYGFQYRGMGGVVTTVWDLWRWDRALDKSKILDAASLEELFRPGLNDYALGWFVKRERGRLVQYHTGSVRGFVCEGRRFPDDDACIFVLSNDDSTQVSTITTAIEQILFEEPVTVSLASPGDAKEGAFLVGRYTNDQGSELSIEIKDDQIRAQVAWKDGNTSRMLIAKDDQGHFAVFVNADRYDLKISERTDSQATTIDLWGRTFRRVQD
ncbi:MAG: beta-lactamase family protein [Planctomycetes bacterium]|nr:beta-lactamase family protein [Planctomycetota bacterium]